MARGLIVEIIGDDSSLQKAFKRAGAAASKFAADVDKKLGRGVSVSDQFAPVLADTRRMQAEADALSGKLRNMEAGFTGAGGAADDLGGGMGKLALKAGLAGAAISTIYQGSQKASDALKTTGREAFTTTGRIKNLGSALLSGDIIGGIQALSALPKTLDEAGISAGEAFAAYDKFKQLAGSDGPFANLAQQAVDLVENTRSAAAAADALADSVARLGTAFRTSTGQAVTFKGAVDDLGGLRGPGLVEQINTNLAAQSGPTSGRLPREIGPTARNAGRLIIAQATGDLGEILRLQVKERDRLRNAIKNATGNREQRIALNAELAQATAAVINTQQAIAEDAKAKNKAAATASKDAASKAWAKIIANLTLGVSRAELTARLNDDLAALNALKAGLQRQVRAGVDVASAQSQLVQVTGQIAAKQGEIAANVQAAVQARQFRALGLSTTGEEIVPGIANLEKRINSALQKIAAGTEDVPAKIAQRLKLARNLIKREGSRLTEATRSTINDLIKAATSAFEKTTGGPLTATSALSPNKILDGLGLSRDLEKELRARLSHFNTAGMALAGAGRGTGAFTGRPITIETHTDIRMDGDVVSRAISRHQTKTARRNPRQKRGSGVGAN